MTDTTRDLIQRMADELDLYRQMARDDCTSTHPFADEARAYLAQEEPEGLADEELMAVTPMDYETYISIQQYSSDSDYFYNLKVTNAMNEDYYYTGTVSTLGDVMLCIKHHLKEHTTTETP